MLGLRRLKLKPGPALKAYTLLSKNAFLPYLASWRLMVLSNGNDQNAVYAFQEPIAAYIAHFEGKKEALRIKNRLLWDLFGDI
jgi:hypothetical protein